MLGQEVITCAWHKGCSCQIFSENSWLKKGHLPFPKRQILDCSKLKELADDDLKFDENGRMFSNPIENTVGRGEIALYEQFLLFPQFFRKTCTADT